MPDPILTDGEAASLSAVSKDAAATPQKIKNDAANELIVANVVAGMRNGGIQNSAKDASSGFARPDASQYDVGYTNQEGDLGEYRAGQQGAWDNVANRLATTVPSMALGIGIF